MACFCFLQAYFWAFRRFTLLIRCFRARFMKFKRAPRPILQVNIYYSLNFDTKIEEMGTQFEQKLSFLVESKVLFLRALDYIIEYIIESVFGNVLYLAILPIKGCSFGHIYLFFSLPQKVQQVLDQISVLDNPKLLQLQKGINKNLIAFDIVLNPIKFFFLDFIIFQELILDIIDFLHGFLINFLRFLQLPLYIFWCIGQRFQIFDLCGNILEQQFFLFKLPAVLEMLDQVCDKFYIRLRELTIFAQIVHTKYVVVLQGRWLDGIRIVLLCLFLCDFLFQLGQLITEGLNLSFVHMLILHFGYFLGEVLLCMVKLLQLVMFLFDKVLILLDLLLFLSQNLIKYLLCQVGFADKGDGQVCAQFWDPEIVHGLVFYHIRNVNIFFLLDLRLLLPVFSYLCYWFLLSEGENFRCDSLAQFKHFSSHQILMRDTAANIVDDFLGFSVQMCGLGCIFFSNLFWWMVKLSYIGSCDRCMLLYKFWQDLLQKLLLVLMLCNHILEFFDFSLKLFIFLLVLFLVKFINFLSLLKNGHKLSLAFLLRDCLRQLFFILGIRFQPFRQIFYWTLRLISIQISKAFGDYFSDLVFLQVFE